MGIKTKSSIEAVKSTNISASGSDSQDQDHRPQQEVASLVEGRKGHALNAAIMQDVARAANQPRGDSSELISPLHNLLVKPVPHRIAQELLERNHYLHSLPGGTKLAFGVFLDGRLLGTVTLGAGPTNAHRLVEGATPHDCLTLTRLWLSDTLPKNSESRTIGILVRSIRRHTSLKFLISYSDPLQGHLGIIYQASGWLYTGMSDATPFYDLGDGLIRHSRSLGYSFGSRSLKHFASHSVNIKLVPQAAKYRYVKLLDTTWCSRLRVPVLPYPKREVADANR